MNEITTAVTAIKKEVSLQEWQQRIMDCQSSGMSVRAWRRENGISAGCYYFHLRKIRESVLEENRIVPLEKPKAVSVSAIQIQSGEIHVTLSETVCAEQLTAVLLALKQC